MLLLELSVLLSMSIYWLLNLQRALVCVRPAIRSIQPKQVWLILVPVFGAIWAFIVNVRVSESIAREYRQRGWNTDEARPGFETGAIVCTIACVFGVQYFYTIPFPIASFVLAVALGASMYRHIDRIQAFCERLDKEPYNIPEMVETQPKPVAQAYSTTSATIDYTTQQPTPSIDEEINRWAPKRNLPRSS
jgi:hypothetical protein